MPPAHHPSILDDDEESTIQQTEPISLPLPEPTSPDEIIMYLISIEIPIFSTLTISRALRIFQLCNEGLSTDLWIAIGVAPLPPKPIEVDSIAHEFDYMELFVLVDQGNLEVIRECGFLQLLCMNCAVNLSPEFSFE
nr:uncharacterized protein LOC108056445 [Drosophila takahashii]